MPQYLSPGVYVEELPPAEKPIAGVSTSVAAFVGIVPDQITMIEPNPAHDPTREATDKNPRFRTWTFPVGDDKEIQEAKSAADGADEQVKTARAQAEKDPKAFRDAQTSAWGAHEALRLATAHRDAGTMAPARQAILCTSFDQFRRHFGDFSTHGILPPPGGGGGPGGAGGARAPGPGAGGTGPTAPGGGGGAAPAPAVPIAPGQNQLAHGVFGFFNNGGTRCYVMRFASLDDLRNPVALAPLEGIDEISLLVAPGITDAVVQENIINHCENMKDRFAILDAPSNPPDFRLESIKLAPDTDYGALYFPRIQVFDNAQALANPASEGRLYVSPSGHLAGIYARVDQTRGVHKAPANEVVRGALEVEHRLSKADQDGLNPKGVNCIRYMNGNFRVWGARTIGGDANADLKYVSVRRLLIFLRNSIDEGTQWAVFEPNDRALWARITRTAVNFLTTVWRDGALFGTTPSDAFYVKCDEETNPPSERDLGKLTIEIGVAIVRPAEFVIFRISQQSEMKPR